MFNGNLVLDSKTFLRLHKGVAWISSKYLNEKSIHDKLTTSINATDGKVKINFSSNYQYVSHSNLSLVVKHLDSNLKVAFVAPTKVYKVHNKAVLSIDTAENAMAVSSCEQDNLLVWDSRTGKDKGSVPTMSCDLGGTDSQ